MAYKHSANDASIKVTMPEGSMTMTYPTSDKSNTVHIRLHAGGQCTIPPHWHETHSEYMRVLQGYMLVTIGNTTKVYGPNDGAVHIPRFAIHTLSQATVPAAKPYFTQTKGVKEGWEQDDVIFEEWTDPQDGLKEIFFRHTLGFYRDFFEPIVTKGDGWTTFKAFPTLFLHVFELINHSRKTDNYMALLPDLVGKGKSGQPNWAARMSTYALYRVASSVSWLCGFTWWRPEYTPVGLHAVCRALDQ